MTELIEKAFLEDLPNGDLTTQSIAINTAPGTAKLIAKDDIVLSGKELFQTCFHYIDKDLQFNWQFEDSAFILSGQIAATIRGNIVSMLKAERVALNFLGHLSGIATYTRCFNKQVEHTKCKILDTRKTTPLFRNLEKQAVVHGKGVNHRMNLSDAILIKENHIALAGGIKRAIKLAQQNGRGPVEVETKNLEEVQAAVEMKVDRIMLDNMTNEQIKECLSVIPKTIETEASGNMSLERVKSVAELGVNFISIGAITHSAPCADFSLIIESEK